MTRHLTDNQPATGTEALSLAGATATGLFGARFAGAFLAAVFLTVAFFANAGFGSALAFVAATAFSFTFLVTAHFTVALVDETAFAPEAPSSAATIRNFERSLAPANHAGAGPRPLHVAPLFGSRYFGVWGPFT